ncbi:hypothetical protein MSG28_006942 [Choristoneura fumiferana]|uniref:Uncharacterized protein n=1 Tax=Choristoneura fumiferana TaxID=7141 RepID=A0ACC0JM04_CHOFU|nr:hypothetical protein MSG28_006942 [Choristoneura fumiferana]
MMFDPPDFPYKELSETLRDHYDSEYLLFNVDTTNTDAVSSINKDLAGAADQIISNVGNHIDFDTTECLDTGNTPFLGNKSTENLNVEQNTELYIVQSDNLLNYEPTLLDENTVNQFLLPLQISSDTNKETEDTGPDILALHSCVICHEIFTTEADLLDHTISFHASDPNLDPMPNSNQHYDLDLDSFWLVCGICQRVLSTALEIEPTGTYLLTFSFFGITQSLINTQDHAEDVASKECGQIFCACDICEKRFSSIEELKMHAIGCQTMGKKDRRSYSSGGSSKMWNCGSCNQLFATARELYRHKRGEDRPTGAPLMAYVCEECDKVLAACALYTRIRRCTKSRSRAGIQSLTRKEGIPSGPGAEPALSFRKAFP